MIDQNHIDETVDKILRKQRQQYAERYRQALENRIRQSGDEFHIRTDVKITDIGLSYLLPQIPSSWRRPYRAFTWGKEYTIDGQRWVVIKGMK